MTVAQANLALRLVAARGRTVSFQKLDRAVDDSAKPWRGKADARATPEASVDVPTVFVPPSSAAKLGLSVSQEELVKRSSQIAIAAPGGSSTDDLSEFEVVLDTDGTEYKILFVEVLKPADTRIVYFVGLKQ